MRPIRFLTYLLIYLLTYLLDSHDFNAKMYQIRFWLGLRPIPRWGTLERSPDLYGGEGDWLPLPSLEQQSSQS